MKKKILGALLSIAMIGTLFTGCGQQQGEVEKEASKKKKVLTKAAVDLNRLLKKT